MSEGENRDNFPMGLKRQIPLQVVKSGKNTFVGAARIALKVDSA